MHLQPLSCIDVWAALGRARQVGMEVQHTRWLATQTRRRACVLQVRSPWGEARAGKQASPLGRSV